MRSASGGGGKTPESPAPRRTGSGNGKTFFNYVKKSERASAGLQARMQPITDDWERRPPNGFFPAIG